MNAIAAEVFDDTFFPPTPHTAIDGLLAQYQAMHARLCEVASLIQGERAGAVGYFLHAAYQGRERYSKTVDEVFKLDRAIAALDADYWRRVIELTDLYSVMPQKRRDEWNEAVRELTCPHFTEENVTATLETMLGSRERFLAERVDGIFRGLSRTHVTNTPEAFQKRFIIPYVFDQYGYLNHSPAGLINDLRAIIARFMGRDEPSWNASNQALKICRATPGRWFPFDGGALRVRAYKCGTAHMEVSPEIAWRLNATLACLYPAAIPSRFRTAPPKKAKSFTIFERPLPFTVVTALGDLTGKGTERHLTYGTDRLVAQEVRNVLQALGGVQTDKAGFSFSFPYDPAEVLAEVVTSGCLPDQRSHQFYPTPETLAERLVEMAQIEEGHRCLEPSAGTGAIARLIPSTALTCVEISPLHCRALASQGLAVHEGDFLQWAESAPSFDRILMNPPFADNRAKLHLQAAADLLAPGGRLVAILPASYRGKDLLPGRNLDWSEVIEGAFDGTSVSVVIATVES